NEAAVNISTPSRRSTSIRTTLAALAQENDETLTTLRRLNKDLANAQFVDWQRGKIESEAFIEECKMALKVFELRDKAKAEMDERDRQLVTLAKTQEEIQGSIMDIDEEADSESTEEEEEAEVSDADSDEAVISQDSDDADDGYDNDWRGF
ncbi:hypothetical protein KEM55_005572, partial [Ascosphaera atra]